MGGVGNDPQAWAFRLRVDRAWQLNAEFGRFWAEYLHRRPASLDHLIEPDGRLRHAIAVFSLPRFEGVGMVEPDDPDVRPAVEDDVVERHDAEVVRQRVLPVLPWEVRDGARAWMSRAVDRLVIAHEPILGQVNRQPMSELPDEVASYQTAEEPDLMPADASFAKAVAQDVGRPHDQPILEVASQPTPEAVDEITDEPVDTTSRGGVVQRDAKAGALDTGTVDTNTGAKAQLFTVMTLRHEWFMEANAVLSFDIESYLVDLDALAKSYADQQAKAMFAHIGEVAEAYGQVIDGSGRDLWESILEAIEAIEFSFDENGDHNFSLVLPPHLVEWAQTHPPTKDQERRQAEIMQRKREAWRASQRLEELP